MLLHRLTSPVMAFPDFTKPFVLHTDASQEGLEAVSYQEQDGKLRVLGYGSRTLTPAEKKLSHAHGKIKVPCAVTEKFRDYLYYSTSFTQCSYVRAVVSQVVRNGASLGCRIGRF